MPPSFPIDPPSDFEARSWLHVDERAALPQAHFRIRLPASMSPVALPTLAPSADDSPVSMATMRTREGPRAEIEVIGFYLTREIAPADFLRPLLEDYEVLEERRIRSLEGDHLDALTRKTLDATYLSRWRTVKDGGANGGRLYLLEARAAEADYERFAGDLFASIASFQPVRPSDWPYLERLVSVSRATPTDFLAYYPESWKLEIARDDDGAGVFVANLVQEIAGQTSGRITFVSASEAIGPDALLDLFVGSLSARGATVKMGPRVDAPVFDALERSWAALGSASLGELSAPELTVRVDIGARGRDSYLLGLTSVAPSIDPMAAAANHRALELMRALLRTA